MPKNFFVVKEIFFIFLSWVMKKFFFNFSVCLRICLRIMFYNDRRMNVGLFNIGGLFNWWIFPNLWWGWQRLFWLFLGLI